MALDSGGFASLRAELTAAGVFKHHEIAGWLRLAVLLALLGVWLWSVGHMPFWITALTLPLAAAVATTAAMLGHEGSHGSFSKDRWQNQLLNYLTFPFLTGLSATYWHHKHDGMHHGHPNVTGKDPDVEMWPFVSSKEEYDSSGRFWKWFQRTGQGYKFWPMTPLLSIAMRRSSLRYLYKRVRAKGVDRLWLTDVATITVHYSLWLGLGSYAWGFWTALAVYMSLWSLVGTMLAMIFAPAHVGLPILSDQHNDWIHQLETTRNFRTPRWASWFFVGLDYQVEHHLFPRIAHQELPRARDITRAWCQRNGFPHLEITYPEAFVDVTRTLNHAWRFPAQPREAVRESWAAAQAQAA